MEEAMRAWAVLIATLGLAACAEPLLALDAASAAKDAVGIGKSGDETGRPASARNQPAIYCHNARHGYVYATATSTCPDGEARLTEAQYITFINGQRGKGQP